MWGNVGQPHTAMPEKALIDHHQSVVTSTNTIDTTPHMARVCGEPPHIPTHPELTEAGLSTRAIAPIVGVNQATVVRDVAAADADASPDPAVAAATCPDCGNVLAPVNSCVGCYPPAYDADARAEL